MTEPTTDPETEGTSEDTIGDAPSAIEASSAAGLPTFVKHCPYCDTDRQVQQLVDHPDNPGVGLAPYGCTNCGCEFVSD